MSTDQTSKDRVDHLAALFRSDVLELTLLPTEDCNLRCRYCYEHKADRRMSPQTVEAIKLLISRRAPTLRHLRLGWFGGEPLMARDLVLDISRFAVRQRRENPALDVQGGLSTNGTLLTPELAGQLIAVGMDTFQVSLDGPPEYHDLVRVDRFGGGSFSRIWGNLVALHDTDIPFQVNLRLHLSPTNRHLLGDFVEWICMHLGGDERFRLFFKALAPLGGELDRETDYFTPEEQLRLRSQLDAQLAGRMGSTSPALAGYVCYAARPTAFVIRADGSIVKCTVGLEDPANQIGRLLPDGSMDLDQTAFRRWVRGAAVLDQEAMRCPRNSLI
ncbi:MAG: radical SAM protein [Pseudomonadota bacterium]